jgi:choline monooxygenase
MPIRSFRIDADVARSRTLPAEVYRDAEWFALVRERVLARSWLMSPLARNAPKSGSLAPWTMLPAVLDEPVVLARDAAGVLRALSNVCTHRGRLLVEEPADATRIRCTYHGRCFHLDGRIDHAPGFEGALEFPTEADDLARLPLGISNGFAWAGLRPAVAFDDWIAPAAARLPHWGADGWSDEPDSRTDWEFDANWMLYVDNYLESMHVPFVHRGLAKTLALESWPIELFEHGVLQLGIARDGEPAFDGEAVFEGKPFAGGRIAAFWLWLYPCTMLNAYPWGLSVNVVEPRGPARTVVRYAAWVRDAAMRDRGAGGDLRRVEEEDEGVVLATARGVRGRTYERGRYAPRFERGVHHFHRMLARDLCGHIARPSVIDS